VKNDIGIQASSDANLKTLATKKMDQETQTFRGHFKSFQLSPFETYDLLFVKDLVN